MLADQQINIRNEDAGLNYSGRSDGDTELRRLQHCIWNRLARLGNRTPEVAITSYHWPDLDGVASTLALKELMSAACPDTEWKAVFFRKLHPEARWAIRHLGVPHPESIDHDVPYIVVDASRKADLDPAVKNVLMVIDHREYGEPDEFPRNTYKIENVGALATVVGELYQCAGITPSRESAAILYLAIASNTLKLRTEDTTDRDRAMSERLDLLLKTEGVDIGAVAEEMSVYKTRLISRNPSMMLDRDTSSAPVEVAGIPCAVSQLEVDRPGELIQANLHKLHETLREIQSTRQAEQYLLVAPDSAHNMTYLLVPPDSPIKTAMSDSSIPYVELDQGLLGIDGVVPRKEFVERLAKIKVHHEVFHAYKQGGTFWPQIRAGSHIFALHALFENDYHEQYTDLPRRTLSEEQLTELRQSMDHLHKYFGLHNLVVPDERVIGEWRKTAEKLHWACETVAKSDIKWADAEKACKIAKGVLDSLVEPVALYFRKLFIPGQGADVNDQGLRERTAKAMGVSAADLPEEPALMRKVLLDFVRNKTNQAVSRRFPNMPLDWLTAEELW